MRLTVPTPSRDSNLSETQAAEFLRMPSVIQRIGLGRSTIYRLIAERRFPPPVKLTSRAVGWRLSDLTRWGNARQSAPQTYSNSIDCGARIASELTD